ncbi:MULTISPECIES: hypothetical protein [Campylobacter]|uniref:hypothetical protein n=1 Tax=Campylobacter TaxID=194 RepID=UPI00027A364F|nr:MULTISPECIES: hypothetical protein [Campylobacter]EJP76213.1 hypothetical protein HMPREF1139_2015 [Campylobacter sp. FOBRC14]
MWEQLYNRARQSLLNQAEVTQELCKKAAQEAQELTQNKQIPTPMLLDLAMFRLKLHLKVEIEEWEASLAKEALKLAQSLKSSDNEPGTCSVGMRESIFDAPDTKTWLKFGDGK